jgi:hypothetical protein
MKELYIEGVAIHDGPESCAGVRKGAGEALTGVRAGWAIEPRNQFFGVPTLLTEAEGHIASSVCSRAAGGPCAVGEPKHARNLHAREPGGPMFARRVDRLAGRSGKAEAASLRCTSVGSQTAP